MAQAELFEKFLAHLDEILAKRNEGDNKNDIPGSKN